MRPHRRQHTRLPRPWASPGQNTGVGCHCLLWAHECLLPTPLYSWKESYRIIVVQLLSHVIPRDPMTAARQASLSFTIARSLLRLMSSESVMTSNHLFLCHPLLLLASIVHRCRQSKVETHTQAQSHVHAQTHTATHITYSK